MSQPHCDAGYLEPSPHKTSPKEDEEASHLCKYMSTNANQSFPYDLAPVC